MRISRQQADIIKNLARQTFGEPTEVYLFGSRTDDSARGGDIDLYIQPARQDSLFRKRLHLTSQLQRALGDQKIDIVIAREPQRPIDIEARAKGIAL